MEDLRTKSIFPETITLEEAFQRSLDLYFCLIEGIIRMTSSGEFTEKQSDDLMIEVRSYVAKLPE